MEDVRYVFNVRMYVGPGIERKWCEMSVSRYRFSLAVRTFEEKRHVSLEMNMESADVGRMWTRLFIYMMRVVWGGCIV